jgi:hypothetical protein
MDWAYRSKWIRNSPSDDEAGILSEHTNANDTPRQHYEDTWEAKYHDNNTEVSRRRIQTLIEGAGIG